MKKRNRTIDVLRAFAIIVIMITHSLNLYLGPYIINSIWNYLHFVIVALVFCSGYVTRYSYKPGNSIVQWYTKRFLRLYVPYIGYAAGYFLIGGIPSAHYLFQSITLAGGIDIGWLTLLFIQLALITPVVLGISSNTRSTLYGYIVFCLYTLITTFLKVPSEYSRLTAWFPWSFIFLSGMLYARHEHRIHRSSILVVSLICFIIWIILNTILIHNHLPLTLTLHKYPPDIYYLLFGISVNSFVLFLLKKYNNIHTGILSVISFLSRHSYGLFFLHLLILQGVSKYMGKLTVIETTAGSVILTILVLLIGDLFFFRPKNNISRINSK